MNNARPRHTRPFPLSLGAVALAGILLLAGCNAFGTGDTSDCDDTEECLANADAALNNQDYDSAISALETARKQNPDNAEVRIKLASAKYGKKNFTLLGLKDMATFISPDAGKSTARTKTHVGGGLQCSNNKGEPTPSTNGYEVVDLKENDAFTNIEDNAQTIDEVEDLLPIEFKGTESYDNLSTSLKSAWLTNAAFSNVASAVIDVHDEVEEVSGHLYREEGGGDVLYCAPDEDRLEDLECAGFNIVKDQGGELVTALDLLRDRFSLYGSDQDEAGSIPKTLDNLIQKMERNLTVDASDCGA